MLKSIKTPLIENPSIKEFMRKLTIVLWPITLIAIPFFIFLIIPVQIFFWLWVVILHVVTRWANKK